MSVPVTDPGAVGLSGERLGRLDRWGASLVADGKVAGLSTLVARHGQVAHFACHGMAARETATPFSAETICRIYSMTKPVTSVAVMMLYEEGRFQLEDPISRFLPEFADMKVFVAGSRLRQTLEPAHRPITIRDLLTHTAGLTYHFMEASPVDALYRANGITVFGADINLSEMMARLSKLPLLSQPGGDWNYSVATDVLGHLVAVLSGMPFDEFVRTRILAPLGMTDTDFHVPDAKLARFAANHTWHPADGHLITLDPKFFADFTRPPSLPSGGGGLVSTAPDYLRFCLMLLGGGAVDGVRLLGRRTVALMLSDHIGTKRVGDGLERLGQRRDGVGFGLGFSVLTDPAACQIIGSVGEGAWSGLAYTAFFIDPAEDLAMIFMTQLMPPHTLVAHREMRVLTYQALVG